MPEPLLTTSGWGATALQKKYPYYSIIQLFLIENPGFRLGGADSQHLHTQQQTVQKVMGYRCQQNHIICRKISKPDTHPALNNTNRICNKEHSVKPELGTSTTLCQESEHGSCFGLFTNKSLSPCTPLTTCSAEFLEVHRWTSFLQVYKPHVGWTIKLPEPHQQLCGGWVGHFCIKCQGTHWIDGLESLVCVTFKGIKERLTPRQHMGVSLRVKCHIGLTQSGEM